MLRVEKIAQKFQQKRSFPLILVHHEGKETMVSAYVIDDIIDFMTSLDDQTVLKIIVGETTWQDLGDILQQAPERICKEKIDSLETKQAVRPLFYG